MSYLLILVIGFIELLGWGFTLTYAITKIFGVGSMLQSYED